MVSILIISIAFAGLMQAFPLGLSINRESENATLAAFLAQTKLEELFSADYDDIAAGTIEAKHSLSSDPNDYLSGYQRQTVVSLVDGDLNSSAADVGLKKAIVTVFYQDAIFKKEKSYFITSLISKK
jgi:type II secretory pathway pseudopilin PulG